MCHGILRARSPTASTRHRGVTTQSSRMRTARGIGARHWPYQHRNGRATSYLGTPLFGDSPRPAGRLLGIELVHVTVWRRTRSCGHLPTIWGLVAANSGGRSSESVWGPVLACRMAAMLHGSTRTWHELMEMAGLTLGRIDFLVSQPGQVAGPRSSLVLTWVGGWGSVKGRRLMGGHPKKKNT